MSQLILVCILVLTSHVLTQVCGSREESIEYVSSANAIEDWIIDQRRSLHRIPELLFEEHRTSAKIREVLDELSIPYEYPIAKTGILATIGSGAKPVVALRSDIDALPILEESGVDFQSSNPGVMHACGHDAHMSMLLGAARLLKAKESSLNGTVKLVFQPAEEGGAGGDLMVKEGALDGVDAAFGMHVWPALPTGEVHTKKGTILAGSLVFKATFSGAGGHAAMPHLTRDPVVAASSAVVALQSIVGRNVSPFSEAVVSVTRMWTEEEGSIGAFNVIPHFAHIGGTVRSTSDEGMQLIRHRVQEVVDNQAKAMGCTGSVDWMEEKHPYYPPVVNDDRASDFVTSVASSIFGKDMVNGQTEATMAGEDFAFIAKKVPSAFIFLGIRNDTAGSIHGLHTSKFTMDETVLKQGAALHAILATEFLNRGGQFEDGGTRNAAPNTPREEL
jgi:IAA-amino acid hydrolase